MSELIKQSLHFQPDPKITEAKCSLFAALGDFGAALSEPQREHILERKRNTLC